MESCVDSTIQAIQAEQDGADRIELCKDLELDGLTPDVNVIENTLSSVNIPIKVMIRPRAGNFIYHYDDVKKMEQDIDLCKDLNISEVVIGALTNSANIDIKLTERLASRAHPMAVTFHKAIDYTGDILFELNRLSKIDRISSILTSGAHSTALQGASMITKIINKFGKRFTIIAAGSITNENLVQVHDLIHANEYHGKKIVCSL